MNLKKLVQTAVMVVIALVLPALYVGGIYEKWDACITFIILWLNAVDAAMLTVLIGCK